MSLSYPNKSNILKKLRLLRTYSSASSDEFTSKPIYPPILNLSQVSQKEREALQNHSKIQALNTVEEKLLGLNVPKFYGWESLLLNEGKVPYNFLPFVKSITRTRVHHIDHVPVDIGLTKENLSQLIGDIKQQLEKVLVFHSTYQRHTHQINSTEKPLPEIEALKVVEGNLIRQINRTILSNLSQKHSHLLNAQVDFDPRIEAFWNVGGFKATQKELEYRKRRKMHEELLEEPMSRWIQYFGTPILQLRSTLPLKPLGNIETAKTLECEDFTFDPITTFALNEKRLHGATIPGFWPNDKHLFGLLSFHSRSENKMRPPSFGEDDNEEAIYGQAILSSFAWLLGQACYNGFTTFNDLTYPLTSQAIVSDGKTFSFVYYQMNTCVTFKDNKKRNDCYASPSMELYHSIEDNQVKGWNEQVLEHLLTMYLNKPEERKEIDMKPFLNKKEYLVEHIENEDRRVWLHNKYRWCTSHRNHFLQAPEIYDWEYIYKVAFNTRPMDARKRFFELDQFPLEDRRMGDEMERRYIKKDRRPEGQEKKVFEDMYYPDV